MNACRYERPCSASLGSSHVPGLFYIAASLPKLQLLGYIAASFLSAREELEKEPRPSLGMQSPEPTQSCQLTPQHVPADDLPELRKCQGR